MSDEKPPITSRPLISILVYLLSILSILLSVIGIFSIYIVCLAGIGIEALIGAGVLGIVGFVIARIGKRPTGLPFFALLLVLGGAVFCYLYLYTELFFPKEHPEPLGGSGNE